MHVCHVVHRPRFSGAEVLALALAREHVVNGHESSFIATRPSESSFQSALDDLRSRGVYVWSPSVEKNRLSRIFHLRKTLQRLRPNVVFSHSVLPAFLTRLALVGASTPVVTVLHSGLQDYFGVLRFLEVVFPPPAAVVGVTEANSVRYLTQFAFRGPCVVIPNGIDLARFSKARQNRAGVRASVFRASNDVTVFLQVGRLAAAKHVELSINAFERLKQRSSRPAKLCFVGIGEDIESTSAVRSACMKHPDEVMWLGPCSEIPELLAACDVCLIPSRWEGHPMVLLEALASGCTVIASDIPAFQFAKKYAGLHFATTPDQFADCMAPQIPNKVHERDLAEWAITACCARYEELAIKLASSARAQS